MRYEVSAYLANNKTIQAAAFLVDAHNLYFNSCVLLSLDISPFIDLCVQYSDEVSLVSAIPLTRCDDGLREIFSQLSRLTAITDSRHQSSSLVE